MARKKLSEFTAKTLLFGSLQLPYSGTPVILNLIQGPVGIADQSRFNRDQVRNDIRKVDGDGLYVVKVDEGVKGRMKKGLVKLKVTKEGLENAIKELSEKGYHRFLIEPFVPHESSEERYFSMERTRDGIVVYYSNVGGIDIEQNQDKVRKAIIPFTVIMEGVKRPIESSFNGRDPIATLQDDTINEVIKILGIDKELFIKIIHFFEDNYVSFLEVNPLVVRKDSGQARMTVHFLDLAIEIDSAAEFFLPAGRQGVKDSWTAKDFVGDPTSPNGSEGLTNEAKNIVELKAKSQAAFKFDLLNKDGSIWVLLSGGGASIVLADEVYNQGSGEELANYGEYSGNPNTEETYIYTKNVLSLLLKSKAKKKVLVIGGGVANFTDIKKTFTGVIQALDEVKENLLQQKVKVFVRRGGPNQEAGLRIIKDFLENNNLLGKVVGPDVMITDIINDAIKEIK